MKRVISIFFSLLINALYIGAIFVLSVFLYFFGIVILSYSFYYPTVAEQAILYLSVAFLLLFLAVFSYVSFVFKFIPRWKNDRKLFTKNKILYSSLMYVVIVLIIFWYDGRPLVFVLKYIT